MTADRRATLRYDSERGVAQLEGDSAAIWVSDTDPGAEWILTISLGEAVGEIGRIKTIAPAGRALNRCVATVTLPGPETIFVRGKRVDTGQQPAQLELRPMRSNVGQVAVTPLAGRAINLDGWPYIDIDFSANASGLAVAKIGPLRFKRFFVNNNNHLATVYVWFVNGATAAIAAGAFSAPLVAATNNSHTRGEFQSDEPLFMSSGLVVGASSTFTPFTPVANAKVAVRVELA